MAGFRAPFFLLLTSVLLACGGARSSAPVEATSAPAASKPTPVLAIRASEALAAELREGSFFRWAVPRLEGVRIEAGPEASGDTEVWLDHLPVSPAVAASLKGLPVEVGKDGIVLGGTRYPDSSRALAVRLPEVAKPTWVLVGGTSGSLIDLADDVLFRLASSMTDPQGNNRRGRRRAPLEVDYLLRETQWMERSGRWARAAEGGWTLDRATERDDFADWDRRFAEMAPIRGERVVLLVPPGERSRPELVRLAAELDRAVAEMAPRVPVAGPLIMPPVTVLVEPDYVAQGRHTGDIGEAVPGQRADLHLVYDSADLPAYRYALAKVLLDRAGLAGKVPIALERGAALWLSRDWYGRAYSGWLPLLAAARVLPEPGEILAREEPADASAILWTPAAAAVVERLPGETAAEKLALAPSAEWTGEILNSLRAGSSPPLSSSGPVRGPSPPFFKGVSLAMMNSLELGYHSPSIGRQLDSLAAMGANSISLMPFASQRGPNEPELRFLNRGPGSETDIGLIHATRLARAHQLHVLYKPHLWVSGGSWPGDVRMSNDRDWTAWWRSYRRYILHHAVLASWAGADLFSVGVELSKTVDREAEWRDLIASTRLFFPRAVTYSGNWYGDVENVKFWDRLDYVGIDTYFPLAASPQASRADLDKGAAEVAAKLAALSRRAGRPVLLTEVGFAAHKAAWMAPHTEGGEYSEEDQAMAYQALFKALARQPWLAGTFVWKAFSGPASDSSHEADFRFIGRKAEGEIRKYFGKVYGRAHR
jgi:hypothetical protein